MKEGDSLRCDKDLNIYATRPLDPRKMNRVRFSMVVDINLLSFEVRDRLWGDKDCLKSVICTINEKVRDHSDFFNGTILKQWEPWMLNPIWYVLTGIRPVTSLGDESSIELLLGEYSAPYKGAPQSKLPPGFSIPEDYAAFIKNRNLSPRTLQFGYIVESKE